MRILIDIGHPAHVHFFRHAIQTLREHGHEIAVMTKDKEVTLDLLEKYRIPCVNLGKPGTGLMGKARSMILFDYRVLSIARQFRPDLLVGLGSPYLGHVSRMIRRPYISFWDTENATLLLLLSYPFVDTICTPACFLKSLGKRQVRYEGYKELAYLHPHHFQPDPSVLEDLGLLPDERFIIVRFISWGASHDVGLRGVKDPVAMIRELEKYGRVFVSAEKKIAGIDERNMLKISPEKFHSLLSYAQLYIGEGGTIATEAAVLGTPAIHIESDTHGVATGYRSGNFRELMEKYGMMFFYPDEENALKKAVELLSDPALKAAWQKKREVLLKDKIDVSLWMIRFIEEYPESFYQYRASPHK
jgi:uncharacterized protein